MDDSLHSYLLSTIKEKDDAIRNLESFAFENHVPIMEPLGIEFLQQIIRMVQPINILEIGAAIGYSAIQMANAYPKTHIVTIERDEERYTEAVKNIEAFGLADRIEIIKGDALEEVDLLKKKGPYDLLFIDAAKGQYKRFFETYAPSVWDEGVIVSDNVLFKGYVAKEKEVEKKRIQKIVEKIRDYNEWLHRLPNMHTTIIPIGDGIAITVKLHN